MIKILYFASLREQLDTASEELDLPGGVDDLAGLADHLSRRGGAWGSAFDGSRTVMMALNQEAARADAPLRDGDEVAFYPPVTGG